MHTLQLVGPQLARDEASEKRLGFLSIRGRSQRALPTTSRDLDFFLQTMRKQAIFLNKGVTWSCLCFW